MARIRSIKPEFWTSEQIMECSPNARLLFVGIWTFSDDAGIHPASAKTLKAEVFPSDDITADTVGKLIHELVTQGLLVEFEASGKRYWHVTGWNKHQRIDKPTYRYPRPDKSPPDPVVLAEYSPNTPGVLAEFSATEWSGVESIGVESTKAVGASAPSRNKGTRIADDWQLPDDYRQWAIDDGLQSDQITNIADRFKDYWISAPGKKGIKADWFATWRNWCRNEQTKPINKRHQPQPDNFDAVDYGQGGLL